MTLVKPLKIERHSNTATRCGFLAIVVFLKPMMIFSQTVIHSIIIGLIIHEPYFIRE